MIQLTTPATVHSEQIAEELRRRNRELAALNAVATAVGQSLDLGAVLDAALTQSQAALCAEGGVIYLLDADRQIFVPAASGGFSENILRELTGFRLGEGISGQSAQSGQPIIVPDLAADPRNLSPTAVREGWHALVSIPLKAKGQLIGAMTLESCAERHFTADSLDLLTAIGHQIGAAVENARLFAETQRLKAFNENIVQGVAEAILIEDAEGLLTFANPASEKLLGYAHDELIGRHWSAVVPENCREAVHQETKNRPSGITTQYETALLGKDGRVVPVIVSGRPLFEAGRFVGVLSVFTDITAHKQVEDALARWAGELAALHEIVLEVSSQQDLDTLLHTIVERVVRLLKVKGGELYLCNPERQETRCVVSYGTPIDYTGMVMKYGEGAAGLVAQTGQPLIVEDYRKWSHRIAACDKDSLLTTLLGVPMIWHGQVIGVVHALDIAESRIFTPDDRELLSRFAAQAAIAVANADLLEAERTQRAQAEALRDTAAALTSALSFDGVLGDILEYASRVVPHDAATIMLVEQGVVRVVRSRGFVERGLPDPTHTVQFSLTDTPNLREIIETGRPSAIPDTHAYPAWVGLPETHWIASHIGVPIRSKGKVIGILNLDSATPGYFTQTHARVLQAFADQVAIAVERLQWFEAIRRRATELEALADLSTALRAAHTADEIIPIFLARGIAINGAATGQVFRVEPEAGALVIWGWYPPDLPFHPQQQVRHRLGEGVAGRVALTGQVHITEDILSELQARVLPEEAASLGAIHGGLTLPLRAASGRIVGVVQFGWRERHTCAPEEVRLLISIAEMAGNALERAQTMDTLEQRVIERTAALSRREAELQVANTRLADLERLKSQFLANASHELRTPLTNVKAYLSLVERGRPEKREHYMTVLKHEANLLHLLVENLLDVAEMDFGRVQPRPILMDVNELLGMMQETCDLLVTDRSLRLQWRLAPDLPLLKADVRMLRQVIANLVSFAAEQSASGETLTIQTQRWQEGEAVWVTLALLGPGLSAAPAMLVQGLAQVDRSQAIMPGAGLRLAICQEIIGRLGGKITTASQTEGAGSLTVWLPAGG